MSLEEGVIGVCIWFGAPTMHRISRLNLACHWHVVSIHVNDRGELAITYK